MDVLLTFDVERHSFETNTHDDGVPKRIEQEALPPLLDLLDQHQAKSTFFLTAFFAKLAPQAVEEIVRRGHEVGCHGYDHDDDYSVLSLEEQKYFMQKSKAMIEEIANVQITSFRSPALRINQYTAEALEANGFLTDSSVSSQRFDGPFTSAAREKLKWMFAPRLPYKLSYESPYRSGDSSITEVPISALLWPFVCTHLRIAPTVTLAIQRLLMLENKFVDKPIVFLMHPQEIMDFRKGKNEKKKSNFFAGYLRHQLKMRNLGDSCFEYFKQILQTFEGKEVTYKQIKDIEAVPQRKAVQA